MKVLLPDWLVIIVWRALLGEIYPSIRAIAAKINKENYLHIRYYLDRVPVDMDYESIEIVATNIAASTEKGLIANIEVDCQFSSDSFGELDLMGGFIYCRREYEL